MADAGGGNAHYAETADAAPAIFSRELDGLTQIAAQNVSIEIRPCAEVQVLGILNEYPHIAVPGGVQVALGDAYAGEKRRVVFELHVPHLAALGPAPVAEIVLRYVSVGAKVEQHEVTIPLAVNLVSADEAAASAPDLEVREEVLVLKAARARDEAIRLADAGENEQAQAPDVDDGVAAEARRHERRGRRAGARAAAARAGRLQRRPGQPQAPALRVAQAQARPVTQRAAAA